MKSSLFQTTGSVCLLFLTSCSTPNTKRCEPVNQYVSNTIIIKNDSKHYSFTVCRNGVPWMTESSSGMRVQVIVSPGTTYVFSNCSTKSRERIKLDVLAHKTVLAGCMVIDQHAWQRTYQVTAGFCHPPIVIVPHRAPF